jgi:hypothetical protein
LVKHVDTESWWFWFNSDDWSDRDTSDLLQAVSNRLYAEQRALASINIQSDSYPVLVIDRTAEDRELVHLLRAKLAVGSSASGALRWQDITDEWA